MAIDIRISLISRYESLSQSEKKIADFILNDQNQAAKMSIQDFSQQTNLSTATISRFAKTLGFENFPALKIALNISSKDSYQELEKEFTTNDNAITLAQKVLTINSQSLLDTATLLSKDCLDTALSLLENCQRLSIFGMGASQIVAYDAHHKFMRTALTSEFNFDYHMQLMAATRLRAQDCALVISHSGRNQEIMNICKHLTDNHVPIIAITSNAGSPLTEIAAVTLISYAEETAYRSEATSALQAQFGLIDVLFLLYSLATDTRDNEEVRVKIRNTINETRLNK